LTISQKYAFAPHSDHHRFRLKILKKKYVPAATNGKMGIRR